MINDVLIADAAIHGYNWAESNWKIPVARETNAGGYGLHQMLAPDGYRLTEAEFLRNWVPADVSETMFLETPTDVFCHHGTPIWDYYIDGHCDTEKGFDLHQAYPERTLLYGAISPWISKDWRNELKELVDRGVNGIKVYAARYDNGATMEQRLDSKEIGYPFIERCLELGVDVIATHKAIPFGPVDPEPYGVADIPAVLKDFPEMRFEIVHAGFAFVDETVALADAQNCWFNLEMSFAFAVSAPDEFAHFIGKFLKAGAVDRVMYSSGFALTHPVPALDAFASFQIPDSLIEECGYPQITEVQKAAILGENLLRLHHIDTDALRARIGEDEISSAQRSGLQEPWSNVRRRLAQP